MALLAAIVASGLTAWAMQGPRAMGRDVQSAFDDNDKKVWRACSDQWDGTGCGRPITLQDCLKWKVKEVYCFSTETGERR